MIRIEDIRAMTDEELKKLALEKKKNGNASGDAYKAQGELYNRRPLGLKCAPMTRGTKRYSHNEDYMPFESDNR